MRSPGERPAAFAALPCSTNRTIRAPLDRSYENPGLVKESTLRTKERKERPSVAPATRIAAPTQTLRNTRTTVSDSAIRMPLERVGVRLTNPYSRVCYTNRAHRELFPSPKI